MEIGILGTGNVARTLATGLTRAGHSVRFGSRHPDERNDLDGRVVEPAQAIAEADVVISAVAASESLENVRRLGAPAFAGKIVLDLGNAVTPDFTLIYPNASLAEALQAALPDAHVVKSLNTIPAALMVDPGLLGPSSVFVSGNDVEAKRTVTGLLTDLGWPPETVVDLGAIESARGPEHYFLMFAAVMRDGIAPLFNIALVTGAPS